MMWGIGRALMGGVVGAAVLVHAATTQAQIAHDGSTGAAKTLSGPNYTIQSTDGQVIGGKNLFHSFSVFNVLGGESATFFGPSSIVNIISRVTGVESSAIKGLIDTRTHMSGANFFLLNPNGIMVGPGAVLDVGGAVHLSTAHYLRFGNGEVFCVTACPAGQSNAFSVSDPSAFGFLGPSGLISVDGAFLQLDPGKSLSLVGGNIEVKNGAFLSTPGGRVQIASVASEGEVTIPGLDVTSFSRLGSVDVVGSTIDVSAEQGGTVVIRAGTLQLDGSTILSVTSGDLDGAATGIDLLGSEQLTVTNGSTVATGTNAGTGRAGDVILRGGEIRVNSGSLEIGSTVASVTSASGRGGDVQIKADAGQVIIDGFGSNVATQSFADGNAGDLSITTGAMAVTGGAAVGSASADIGAGGNVTITATGGVTVSGRDVFGTASGISTASQGEGDGGTLSVSAQSLVLSDFGSVISSTLGTGQGGDIVVNVGELTIGSRGTISSLTAGSAPAGAITVTATQSASISGLESGILSSSFGGFPAGDITLRTGALTVTDRALIQSGNPTARQGGNVFVTATGPVLISDGSGISAQAFGEDVGQVVISAPSLTLDNGFISTATLATGNAGPISLNVGTLTMTHGGQIVSSSERGAAGNGGDVTIVARESLSISGSGTPSAPFSGQSASGIFSTASGTGRAGNINITASGIDLGDGATIAATSSGTAEARAGDITIVFGERLAMDHASITTDALLADGGNITISSTGSLLLMIDSQITTSVRSGDGSGGNITIGSVGHPLDFIVLNDSGIHADAFGGPGGNINIFADIFLSSTPIETAVTASSQLSQPGTVNIEASITDVSGSLAKLPEALLEAAALLRASCAARLAEGKASSLVVAGREGLPLEPGGGMLPSPLLEQSPLAAAPGRGEVSTRFPALSLSVLDPKCWR